MADLIDGIMAVITYAVILVGLAVALSLLTIVVAHLVRMFIIGAY